jgi:hypothetical protein
MSRIKSKSVRATLNDKNVLEMFQNVMGTSSDTCAIHVIYPNYLKMEEHTKRFLKLLTVLHNSNMMKSFPEVRDGLAEYLAMYQTSADESFCAIDLSGWEDLTTVPKEFVMEFMKVYTPARKCAVVNMIIVVCKNLIVHKKSLENQAALKDKFLVKSAGLSFSPLPDFPQLNFKQMYISDTITACDKEFILIVLHKMLTIGHDLYEVISAPEVDVDDFVNVIISNISEVKKHIPRCDEAFQKIVESVDLLKGNFNGYYKDYTASGNPTVIMENFVLDVSKNTKSSPTVTSQFRKIISHYRKISSQQAANSKLGSLFKQVDANFQELERRRKNADAEESSDDESEDEGAAAGAAGSGAASTPTSSAAGGYTSTHSISSKTMQHRRKRAKAKARAAAAKASTSSLAAELDIDSDASDSSDDDAMVTAAVDAAAIAAVDASDDDAVDTVSTAVDVVSAAVDTVSTATNTK